MKKQKGFTLIELLVVITIIAILAAAGLVTYNTFIKNSRDNRRQSDLKFVQSALEAYFSDQLYYPSTITFGNPLTNCTGGITSCTPSKTYLTAVPKDPLTTNNQYSYVPSLAGCDNNTANKCITYCLYANLEGTAPPSDNGCIPSGNYDFGVNRP